MKPRRIERAATREILARLKASPPLLIVLVGARQTGKTTIAEQVAQAWPGPAVLASADLPIPPGPEWIETHWSRAERLGRRKRGKAGSVLLVLDEIQKVRGWSETIKSLWDRERRNPRGIRPLLLGSSSLLMQKGLTESLAGRFFQHRSPHWSFVECRKAFGWSLDEWIFYGGYPGAAALLPDEDAWRRYVSDSLIETAIARDVLQMQTVTKPALLRHLFGLAVQHPAEIVSYNKMLGTLRDAGNTVTLANYLRLLETAFLVSGLDRLTATKRQRASSPKLVIWNSALVTALSGLSFREARADDARWGRLVENAVGAHLLNNLPAPRFSVGYWRERNDEVDYAVSAGGRIVGIEVKSGRTDRRGGVEAFRRRFPSATAVLVGRDGIPLREFFETNPVEMLPFPKS